MSIEYFSDNYPITLPQYKTLSGEQLALPPIPDSVWITGAPTYWAQGIKGDGCKVGVIDTGIDNTHPDLFGRVLFRRDYVKDGSTPSQFHDHGTHVAGTICANGKIKGIAPLANLIDYRVLGRNGNGSYDNITKAITDATNDGCNIVNLSLGGPYDYPPLRIAIGVAVSRNVLVVAAAGNSGPNTISYPAYYPETVSVGAVDFNIGTGTVSLPYTPWFSSSNNEVDMAADGYNVLSTIPNNRYAIFSGTSMATPNISGIAALIWKKLMVRLKRVPTRIELLTALKGNSIDVLATGNDTVTGVGFITLYPELPKKVGTSWVLPSMAIGQP